MDNTPLEADYQQGDVIMRRIADHKPCKYTAKQRGRCVIAEGEGHHIHVIDAPETDAELIEEGNRMLLWLEKPAAVRHEIVGAPGSQADHKPRTIAAGLWEIGNVNEVDHFTQTVRPVMD